MYIYLPKPAVKNILGIDKKRCYTDNKAAFNEGVEYVFKC